MIAEQVQRRCITYLIFILLCNPNWVFLTCTGIKLAFTPFPDFGLKERWT